MESYIHKIGEEIYITNTNALFLEGALSFKNIDVSSIINIETKKSILEFGLKQFKK